MEIKMELIFRKIDTANPADIADFNELMDDLTHHAHDQALLLEKIKKINVRKDAYLLVAEDAETGKLCGSTMAITFDDFCDDCKPLMIIENVVVHHDYRQKGVGRRMFAAIEDWGRSQNVNYGILCSGMNRLEAHQFYHNIGYEEVKGFKKYL